MARTYGAKNSTKLLGADLARPYGPECFRILMKIARSEKSDQHARVKAAELVAAYAYGKPTEKRELGGPNGGAIPVSIGGVDNALKAVFDELRSGPSA